MLTFKSLNTSVAHAVLERSAAASGSNIPEGLAAITNPALLGAELALTLEGLEGFADFAGRVVAIVDAGEVVKRGPAHLADWLEKAGIDLGPFPELDTARNTNIKDCVYVDDDVMPEWYKTMQPGPNGGSREVDRSV